MSDTDPNEPMSLNDMRAVITFLMSKLSPADLEELDEQMLGKATPMASDSRFGDATNRANLLRLGPKIRQGLRDSLRRGIAQDSASSRSFERMFPDVNRLRG